MSRPDRRWRPSDADRERYAAAVSQAYAEGRIDAADMESRTALIYEAKSIADLDALVDDMPAPAPPPAPPPRAGAGIWIRLAIGAAVIAAMIVALLLTFRTDDPEPAAREPVPEGPQRDPVPEAPPAEEPDEVAELPAIDTEQLPMFSLEGLRELWAAAAQTDVSEITLFAERASLRVRAASAHRALATVEYQGGLLLPPTPWRDLSDGEPDAEVFFPWDTVTPEAVMAAIDGMPAATGLPDVTVGHISIGHYQDGLVTISVYPEGDTGVTYVRWDPTGQEVIRVY